MLTMISWYSLKSFITAHISLDVAWIVSSQLAFRFAYQKTSKNQACKKQARRIHKEILILIDMILQGLVTHFCWKALQTWILCNSRIVYKRGFGARWQVDNKIYDMSQLWHKLLEGWSLQPTFLRHFTNQPKNIVESPWKSSSIWILRYWVSLWPTICIYAGRVAGNRPVCQMFFSDLSGCHWLEGFTFKASIKSELFYLILV